MRLRVLLGMIMAFYSLWSLAQNNATLDSQKATYPKYYNTGNQVFDDLKFRSEVYHYLVQYKNYPDEFLFSEDIEDYQKTRLIKEWNKSNPNFAEDLKVFTYQEWKLFIDQIKNPILEYPSKPKKPKAESEADAKAYKMALEKWAVNHPNYPRIINTGNPKEDAVANRKARIAFYETYIKEK
ncbi:MAG: hypothetical protein JXR60_04340 [Bacteroidales bacterium]|nr:hypothetical protein [Bacteroidales bacterium]